MAALPAPYEYESVWGYLWDRKRYMAWGISGIVWCVFWFFWWAGSWWMQAAFELCFVINVWAMGGWVQTYYRYREPPLWVFSPDAMIIEFTRDEKDDDRP